MDAKRIGYLTAVKPSLDQLQDLGFRLSQQTWEAVLKLAGESKDHHDQSIVQIAFFALLGFRQLKYFFWLNIIEIRRFPAMWRGMTFNSYETYTPTSFQTFRQVSESML